MKVIVAGSRSVTSKSVVFELLNMVSIGVTELVSGAASGVDTLGEEWAKEQGIAIKQFPADWEKLGKRAGYVRNEQMAEYADALIAIWDGVSPGSKHMIDVARNKDLSVYVVTVGLKESAPLVARPAPKAMAIHVPYSERDEAKALGAKWSVNRKTWYLEQGQSMTPFEKWISEPALKAA